MELCSLEGCRSGVQAKRMCGKHYRAQLVDTKMASERMCTVEACDRARHSNGICLMHYKRIRRNGTTVKTPRHAGESDILPGYVRVMHDGYIRLVKYDTPSGKPHRVMEHRAIMEKRLGRAMMVHENVHHINGKRDDNRPENLELWTTMQPSGQRVEDKVAWAREILATYSPVDLASLTIINA